MPLMNPMSMFVKFWKRDAEGVPIQSGNRKHLDLNYPGGELLRNCRDIFPISAEEEGAEVPFQMAFKALKTAMVRGRIRLAENRWKELRDHLEEQLK